MWNLLLRAMILLLSALAEWARHSGVCWWRWGIGLSSWPVVHVLLPSGP